MAQAPTSCLVTRKFHAPTPCSNPHQPTSSSHAAPKLFDFKAHLNKGRLPSAEKTRTLCKSGAFVKGKSFITRRQMWGKKTALGVAKKKAPQRRRQQKSPHLLQKK